MTKPDVDNFSRAFYPFLHDEQKDSRQLMEDLGFSLLEKARESVDVKTKFFSENKETILAASLQLAKTFHRGHKLLVCGNGGSATDAQHIAVEFMHPITVGRKALPAIVHPILPHGLRGLHCKRADWRAHRKPTAGARSGRRQVR